MKGNKTNRIDDLPFCISTQDEPHAAWTIELLQKYPELRQYISKRNPWTALICLLAVVTQTAIGISFRNVNIVWAIGVAWLVGSIFNHVFIAIIHEASHNLIFKKPWMNKWVGILANLPMIVPSSTQFQKYHLLHHKYQGDYFKDADIPSRFEVDWVGNVWWRKILWMSMYPLWQILRPGRVQLAKFMDGWFVTNFICCALFATLMIGFFGWVTFAYLFASFWLCFGLSASGGRLIQEHYLTHPPQETYSYYGPLTYSCLHVGHHNEHHDFSYCSWNHLPKIRRIAKDHYDSLVSYQSWGGLMLKFIFDPNMSLRDRMVRDTSAIRAAKKSAFKTAETTSIQT